MRRRVDADRVRALARALGQAAGDDAKLYLTGGATAVLEGWRETTVDVDIKLEPESDALLRRIPELKEELELNVELASRRPTSSPSFQGGATAVHSSRARGASTSTTSTPTRRRCRSSNAPSSATSPM